MKIYLYVVYAAQQSQHLHEFKLVKKKKYVLFMLMIGMHHNVHFLETSIIPNKKNSNNTNNNFNYDLNYIVLLSMYSIKVINKKINQLIKCNTDNSFIR